MAGRKRIGFLCFPIKHSTHTYVVGCLRGLSRASPFGFMSPTRTMVVWGGHGTPWGPVFLGFRTGVRGAGVPFCCLGGLSRSTSFLYFRKKDVDLERLQCKGPSLSLPNPHPFPLLLPDQGVEGRAQGRVRSRCSC